MSKHTPGLWDVYNSMSTPGARHGIEAPEASIILWGDREENGKGVHGRDKEEEEANARLIAAAPELLEALQMMLRGTQADCGRICMPNDAAVIAAFAAIAKATGATA